MMLCSLGDDSYVESEVDTVIFEGVHIRVC